MSESRSTHTSVHLKGRNHLGDLRTKEEGGIKINVKGQESKSTDRFNLAVEGCVLS